MNVKPIIAAVLLLAVAACQTPVGEEKTATQNQPGDLRENLPIADRDLLLEPLESALDDVREVVMMDESNVDQVSLSSAEGAQGTLKYKLEGTDTVLFIADLQQGALQEHHEWFRDHAGNIFFSAHRFDHLNAAVGQEAHTREYKFYFEDNGSKLSTYARMSYDNEPLPTVWTPVCLTREEELFLEQRTAYIRQLSRASQPQ